MPAATTKTDLLATTEAEFSKLTRLLDKVPVAAQTLPDADADGTTLKDTIGHRAHWVDLFLGWYT
ncbi:MAG: ClbS/DfsB family four-helix bundle protein, partial [Pseudomonadota bacterium]|nr:ClbS/DfsB family four-helix bundle protein [Pseudomonadota bacterium]